MSITVNNQKKPTGLLVKLGQGALEADDLLGEASVQRSLGQGLRVKALQLPGDTVQQGHIPLSGAGETHTHGTSRNVMRS